MDRDLDEYEHEVLVSNIENIVQASFPKLAQKRVKIGIKTFKSVEYLFESRFKLSRLFFKRPKYFIKVNPIIFDEQIPLAALRGVLAHELVHTEDYEKHWLINLGIRYLFKGSRINYERQTDLETIIKGHGQDLIEYRHWLYAILDEEQVAKKKRHYLTPEEIELIISILDNHPQLVEKWRKKRIPRSLAEFHEEINRHIETN